MKWLITALLLIFVCCSSVVVTGCSRSMAATGLVDNEQTPAYLAAVPDFVTLGKVATGIHTIDSAVPADDGAGGYLHSAGVSLGHPTTTTAGPLALEWVIYAISGFGVEETPSTISLDLSGSTGTVWAGTSDYERGAWRWQAIAEPFSSSMSIDIPNADHSFRSSDGVLFLALAVWNEDALSFNGGSASGNPLTQRLIVLHRSGQSFITWPERQDTVGERYKIYRDDAPIDSADDLTGASLIYEVAEGSGNFYADRYNVDGSGTWQARYLERFVITDAGQQLPAGVGLLVWTLAQEDFDGADSGIGYYAVTITPDGGSEDTSGLGGYLSSEAITESVSDPVPVEIEVSPASRAMVFLQYMDLRNWNPTFHAPHEGNQYYGLDPADPAVSGSIQYAFCYSIGMSTAPPPPSNAIIVNLHGWNGNSYGPDQSEALYTDTFEIRPVDIGETWYFGFAQHHDYRQSQTVPAGDVICNFTEYRILRMIKDLLVNPTWGGQCDPNRIYIYGHSMGGSGTLAFSLRYPTLFAAAYASQPMTDYLTDPVWENDVSLKFGARALNLPVDLSVPGDMVPALDAYDGVAVYDWQNHEAQVLSRISDESVPLGIGHGRLDEAIHWPEQGRGMYTALDAANRCWGGYIEDLDHQWMSYQGCPPSFAPDDSLVPFAGLGMVLDETVPGLSNCSRNGILPPLDPPAGVETYNSVIEWSSSWNPWAGAPVDDTSMWSMSFRTTDGVAATVDITPRRMASFHPWSGGVPYVWTNRRLSDNTVIDQGIVSTGMSDEILTVESFAVSPEGNKLEIEGPLPPG